MDIDHPADLPQADRRVLALMRLLTHLNAGAVLALCLWLVWAAWQAGEPEAPGLKPGSEQGCGCALTQAPAVADDAVRLASHHDHSFIH